MEEVESVKIRKPRRLLWLAVGAVPALGLGVALGAAPTPEETEGAATQESLEEWEANLGQHEAALEKRQEEIDAWVAPEPEIVEVAEVPEICSTALDAALDVIQNFETIVEIKGEFADMILSGDYSEQDSLSVHQDRIFEELEVAEYAYIAAALECDPDWQQ